ncbi:MAG: polysaccharide deacetylase family protein [Bacteroidota bacterium]
MKEKSSGKIRAMQMAAKYLKLTGGFPIRNIYGGVGQILMFHRVIPEFTRERIWSNSYLEVTTDYFEKVILYYKKHNFEFLSLDELASKGFSLKKKFVAFTFDDGFKDNLYHALPVMKKYDVPLNLYVAADFPDHKSILWWNTVEDVILKNHKLSFEWFGAPMQFHCSSPDEKNETFGKIHSLIQEGTRLTIRERALMFCQIFGVDPYSSIKELALSWDEVRQLSKDNLVVIGAHSVSHPVLSQLSDEDSFNEISQSKLRIEKEIGLKVSHFSYPFGGTKEASPREYEFARKCNFETAVTTVSASVMKSHQKKLLQLPRIAVGMSMQEDTFDLLRFGVIQMMRSNGTVSF